MRGKRRAAVLSALLSLFAVPLIPADNLRPVKLKFEGRVLHIDVPVAYIDEQRDLPLPGVGVYSFAGAKRADGSQGAVQLVLSTLPTQGKIDLWAPRRIRDIERSVTDCKITRSEVQLAGRRATRVSWEGFASENQRPVKMRDMRDIMYVGVWKDLGFMLQTRDNEANASDSLSLGEKSMRTFRFD